MKKFNFSLSSFVPFLIISIFAFSNSYSQSTLAIIEFNGDQVIARKLQLSLANKIINSGLMEVVEREKINSLLEEFNIKKSELMDEKRLVDSLQWIGAYYIMTGDITSLDHNKSTYKNFGLNLSYVNYHMGVSLRIIEVKTGKIVFSSQQSVNQKFESKTYSPKFYNNLSEEIASKIVSEMKLSTGIAMLNEQKNKEIKYVNVAFESFPKNADVEVNGKFLGNTGNTIKVLHGLQNVKISLPGYVPWEKKVLFDENMPMPIKATLVKETNLDSKAIEQVNGVSDESDERVIEGNK